LLMSALSIVNAKKSYGPVQALKGISLEVGKGEFFGLLGPNGAGKTTLIQSVVGLCRLNEGEVRVFGNDVRRDYLKTHAVVGFSPQDMNLDRFFPIRKILMFQTGFYGLRHTAQKKVVDRLLEQFHLTEKADVPYYRLSGGMQRRLLVAKAMVGSPRLLILDEPTAGIDVEQRHELWEYLQHLNRDGTTIILTTHYIDEAEALCRRIAVIHLGEIRETGSPADLIERYCEKRVRLTTSKKLPPRDFDSLGFDVAVNENMVVGEGANVGEIIEKFLSVLAEYPDCRIVDLHVERGTLEDVFIKVTGTRLEVGERNGTGDPRAAGPA
ncbi:MAG: ABC transporter ATP-binding protein, partial [Deltaproteobacteria bacterium]|nr:ABC transporter ATP-binding protein [Deltaproteobacteria bacterium]